MNFVVEHTRVGSTTDFDRLIIEILTDGTIEPEDALAESAETLLSSGHLPTEVDVTACLRPGPARLAIAPRPQQTDSLAGMPATAAAAAARGVPADLPLTPPIP